MKTVLLILSLVINIVLAILYYKSDTPPVSHEISRVPLPVKDSGTDYQITSMHNFESVYFNRNDSVYKRCWGEAFEHEPEKAFLIACSFFYVTKDRRILDDVKVSAEQLEHAYQRKFEDRQH